MFLANEQILNIEILYICFTYSVFLKLKQLCEFRFQIAFISKIRQKMQNPDNGVIFRKSWEQIYNSKDSKLIFMGNVEGFKQKKMGSHYIIYNPSYKNKRSSSVSPQKSVFMNFNSDKFNFSKVSNKEVLFYLNLDEQQIVTKQNAHKITQKFFEQQQGEQGEIQGHAHPVLVNTAPICKYHCLISMYPDQQLPQIVGQDIMLLLLNIFKIFPGVKIGYNSLGGAASVNHLHFHIVYAQQMTGGDDRLPIESMPRKHWLKSSLISPEQQINLYSIGVNLEEICNDHLYCFVLTPIKPKEEELEVSQAANSLAFVFGLIVNQLIQLTVPHNVYISENGMTIYIFARDFSVGLDGWMEFSGVQLTSDENQFEKADQQLLLKRLRSTLIDEKIIELVKGKVKNHLSKFI